MKIRTITTGFHYHPEFTKQQFDIVSDATKNAKKWFEDHQYDVQTIRMSTQPWESYTSTKKELITTVKKLEKWMHLQSIDYFNIGPCTQKKHIAWIPSVLKNCSNGFITASICDKKDIFYEHIEQVAHVIKENALLEPQGFANLRFAALCNISPHTPFYPASFHEGEKPRFDIGLENSDLVYNVFSSASSIKSAKKDLFDELLKTYKPIEKLAKEFSKNNIIWYQGLDTSISTSIDKHESIAYAFEHLIPNYHFGKHGTLTLAKIITDTIQSLPLKKTGYCGLMLPVLEDDGLALRNNEQRFSIADLLLFSAVCGTGLDTIPLPGNISVHSLTQILTDVASLSVKLQKPLSARLMPIPGKKAGDMTEFTFSYFKNSSVMAY